jgi:LPS export ABC transporter protein LptC
MINLSLNRHFLKQAAIIFGCLFIFGCENDPKVIQEMTEHKSTVDEARDVTTLLSQSGRMKARLLAPLMYRYQADTSFVEFPNTLKVDFYDSTAKVESKLSALYGKYFETQGRVYIRDSVVVTNIHGDTMKTTELWWDQNTQRFYTDKPTHVKRKNMDNFTGLNGMEATQDLSEITFLRPKGSFQVTDSTQ